MAGRALLDRADAVRVVLRAAVRQVVAIHRREHDVLEAHELDGVRDVLRLLGIEPAARVAGIHRAEAAGARAHRAHQHDGGRAGVPALADVRALRFLADRGEPMLAHDALHGRETFAAPAPSRAARGACASGRKRPRHGLALMPSRIAVKPCGVTYFSPLRARRRLRRRQGFL